MPERGALDNIFGEIKFLREDLRDFARRAEEDRKRADEDRKKSDARFAAMQATLEAHLAQSDQERVRSDERFDRMSAGLKATNRAAVQVGKDIKTLLKSILKTLRAGTNGKSGSGHK